MKKTLKIIIPIFTLVFALALFLTTGINVYANTITGTNEPEEAENTYTPEEYDQIPDEYKELYSVDKYDWYKVSAEYWLVYHKKHNVDFGDQITDTYQWKCKGSGYNRDHTYAFTRFTLPDGTLINDIKYLEYRYTNEKGVSDNYWQEVNTLANNNTEYDYNGTFLSMDNIQGFDNGNGEIINGALIPGLSKTLITARPHAESKKNKPCKIAYTHEELAEIEFNDYMNESENLEIKTYKPCNYLMYWDYQCIKELAYINIWWVEEKVNEDTGIIEEVVNRGTLTDDGTAVGIDNNGNVGIYSLDKTLLTDYTIREDGIIVNPEGEPMINWDDQCKGAVLNPNIQTFQTSTIIMNGGSSGGADTMKYVFYTCCAIIILILLAWLLSKINIVFDLFKRR